MPEIQLEESRRRPRSVSTQVEPIGEPELPSAELGPAEVTEPAESSSSLRFSTEQRWVIEVRGEIDDYMVLLRQLRSLPPDEVFLELSGITARMAELRLTCVRSESRRLVQLRTREIDPLLEECERQFRFHSRLQAVRQMEWDHTRGIT
jgi:hypothetical protein